MSDFLGPRLVNAILVNAKLPPIFNREYVDEETNEQIDFIRQYVIDNSSFPTREQVEEKFAIELPPDPEPFDYVLDTVVERYQARQIKVMIEEVSTLLGGKKIDKCRDKIVDTVTKIKSAELSTGLSSYKETAVARYKEYQEKKSLGVNGVPTKWAGLNDHITCWANGTLNAIIASTETGKTWYLCICAIDAFDKGKKVLFASVEMDEKRIKQRLDCLRYKLPFRELKDGTLDFGVEEYYEKEMQTLAATIGPDIIIADRTSIKTVQDIELLCTLHKPDIVIIDSAYRLETDKKEGWEGQKSIVKRLTEAASRTNIPWLATSQWWADVEKEMSLHQLRESTRYAKEWIIDTDVTIVLRQNLDLRQIKRLQMDLVKNRDASQDRKPIYINWDSNSYNYDDVLEEEPVIEIT